jgi:predicted transcriptional regulator
VAKNRIKIQRESHREEIAKLVLQNWTQTAIANFLEIGQSTVSRDLQEIRRKWRESAIRDFDEAKAIELAKIDLLEAEYWQQWEKSKQPKRSQKHEEGDRTKVTVTEENRCGNPAYLNGVLACIERRCKLLGLDAEVKYQDLSIAIASVVKAGYQVTESSRDAGSV